MNVQFQRIGSAPSTKLDDDSQRPPSAVRIQPMEFIPSNNDLVPYRIISNKQKHRKIRPKTGCCSKVASNYVMMKSAYPCPCDCSSPAEAFLKSFMDIIKKEQFWAEDDLTDIEEQQLLLTENKEQPEGDKTKDATEAEIEKEEEEKNITVIKEVSEVEERRRKLISADIAEKMKVLIQCIPLTRIAYGDHSFYHAEALVNLAQAYLDWKCYYRQAANHCKTAKTILSALAANETVQANEGIYTLVRVTLCRLLLVEGKALIGLKNLVEAEKMLEKAKSLFDSIKKLPTISEAPIMWYEFRIASAFASLYISQQRFGQAGSSIQSALEIENKKLSALIPPKAEGAKENGANALPEKLLPRYYSTAKRVVDLYHQLGQVEQMRGASADHKAASKWYKKAIDVIRTTLEMEAAVPTQISTPKTTGAPPPPPSSEEMTDQQLQLQHEKSHLDDLKEHLKLEAVNCYLQVSKCQLAIGKMEMAESNVKKALQMFEKPDHEHFIKTGKKCKLYHIIVDELAKIYIKSQKHEEAISLLVDALPSKRTQFGDFSLRVMETYNLLVSLYLFTKDVEKAVSFLQKYMAVCVGRFGAADSRTKDAESTIKILLAGQQDKMNEKKPLTFKIQ